ncbi:bromodomain-containing protein 8 isoform X1 [Triplophysa rosa]|uniref:bromodomain-containing protein 8 isoform X1 n=1 Tax=Triplophysa rosa TaxID=992332 RepID=UPI002545C0AB|nr:bromodomain-containing protein 8 isoform X1 [Triplophysa rosa]
MASGVGKHKLLLGPTEPWSIREKLCLASSVMKSGDQNWVSVSRAIKPFAEPGRPPDWFSQKHCASQYSELLETTEAPKRKRGEKGEVVETVEDVIVRRLTAERIEELKRLIKETQEKHRKLKRESELIQAGHLDSKLEELWEEIVRNRKQEEEEAEVKRKATDAAYQARQAVKNTPRRVPCVTLRSPSGACAPCLDFPIGDSSVDASTTGAWSTVFVPLAELPGPGVVEASLGSLLDESTQKKLLGQKITPPPSPLLSELLKKGSLLPTSPRQAVEGEATPSQLTGTQDIQMTSGTSSLPSSQAATGAPTLSRLLEAGPAQFPSKLSSLATADSAPNTTSSAVDTAALLATGGDGAPNAPVDNKDAVLGDEDLVTVSYMAEELDLETVGDIIAIIEEKGDENAEALDAAAVEAALSLCEDTGHTLTGTWEPNTFRTIGHEPSNTPQDLDPNPLHLLEGKTEGPEACESGSGCSTQVYPSPSAVPQDPVPTSGGCSEPEAPKTQHTEKDQEGKSESVIKSESDEWTQSQSDIRLDDTAVKQHSKEVKEEEEEVAVSDAEEESVLEMKAGLEGGEDCGGEEDAEGVYLSEPEGETELDPPASESEDGCSMHTASSSLQLHTTAESIPSSPASSQFSICSEDQEAIQAQKIWKKAIMLVWRAAANHRYANVFLQPVTDDIAPGYHSIVHRPMDLFTIKKNIENGLIRTTAEFQRDIMLMFQNAVMYNSSDHDVFHMALEMQRDVLEQIQQFLATQLIMQTSESGISAKSLRGREANRKQDPNDKDCVPMASPAFLLSLFDGGTRGRRCAIEADLKMKK